MTNPSDNVWGDQYEKWREEHRDLSGEAFRAMQAGEPLSDDVRQRLETVQWYLNTVKEG